MAGPQLLETVAGEWLRRVQAEYGSAARTHSYVGWLIQIAAPPELIRAGMRVVDDELEHASLAHAVVVATGVSARPAIDQATLGLPRRSEASLFDELLVHGIDIFCLGETVAVPLFVEMRSRCTQPVAKAALDRIVRDEVRHRDFGWEILDWLLSVDPACVEAELPGILRAAFARVRANYGEAGAAVDERPTPATELDFDWEGARAWGLMPLPRYAEILARCWERDYRPRFGKRGFEAVAEAAWAG